MVQSGHTPSVLRPRLARGGRVVIDRLRAGARGELPQELASYLAYAARTLEDRAKRRRMEEYALMASASSGLSLSSPSSALVPLVMLHDELARQTNLQCVAPALASMQALQAQ